MDADGLKAIVDELGQVMPEATRRTQALTQRTAAAAERVAALAARLDQIKGMLDEPGSSLGDVVERLGQTAVTVDGKLVPLRDEVVERLAAWPAALATGQRAIEAARDDAQQAADDLNQRLHGAADALAASGNELAHRATTFVEAGELARPRLDAALDVTLEGATALRDEAQAAQGALVERVHQLVATVQEHQQRALAALRTTSEAFGETGDGLAVQLERVREDLVRSGALGMVTDVRRAFMQEMGPSLESAQRSVLDALREMQNGVAEMCTTATTVRTTMAPLLRDLDGLVGSLEDSVDSVRDAAAAAGVPF